MYEYLSKQHKGSEGKGGQTAYVDGGSVFLPLLTVLFIGLKLTGYITWPWLWVLSPLWLPLVIVLAILVVLLLVAVVVATVQTIRDR